MTSRPGWTRVDEVMVNTGCRLPLHELARLGLVVMEQEPEPPRPEGAHKRWHPMRWWWVEDTSLDALLSRCVPEVQTRTVYHLPADLEQQVGRLKKQRPGRG